MMASALVGVKQETFPVWQFFLKPETRNAAPTSVLCVGIVAQFNRPPRAFHLSGSTSEILELRDGVNREPQEVHLESAPLAFHQSAGIIFDPVNDNNFMFTANRREILGFWILDFGFAIAGIRDLFNFGFGFWTILDFDSRTIGVARALEL